MTTRIRRLGVVVSAIALGSALTATTAQAATPAPRLAWVTMQSWLASGHHLARLPIRRLPNRAVHTRHTTGPLDVPDPDLRSECQNQSSASTAVGWVKSRFETCFHQQQNLVLVRTDNGDEVGTIAFDEWILGFTYDGSRRVDFVPSIENLVVSTQPGYDATTWSIDQSFNTSVTSGPPAGLTRPAEESRNDLLGAWNSTPQWTLTYTSDATQVPTAGSILATYSTVGLNVDAAGAAEWNDPVVPYSYVRYDSAGSGGMKAQGTVFTDATVVYSLSLSDPTVQETARHIDDALHHPERTFPSILGKNVPGETLPLHRLTDPTRMSANSDAAKATCLAVWGPYDGTQLNCDEYPFQSSYEGAAAGDNQYSARLIDAADNQAAGRALLATYNTNRILDDDPFHVQITP